MKPYIVLFLICLLLVFSLPVLAGERVIEKEKSNNSSHDDSAVVIIRPNWNINFNVTGHGHDPRKFAVDWYRYGGNLAMGFKYQVWPDYFSTFNVEFDSRYYDDLQLSLGAFYRVPQRVILWHFYLGGEYTFTSYNPAGYPYVLLGTDFLVFFSEAKYPLFFYGSPVYRAGFRFYF